MPDETATEVQETEETTTEATETTTSTEEEFDKDRAMKTITTLRAAEKEGKRAAKELADARKKLQEFEDSQKSDAEKQAERLVALEAKESTREAEVQDMRLKLAVYSRQTDLAIADADLAIAALDRTKVEWGDDGEPSNLDEVLTDLLERKPLLKGKGAAKKQGSTDARDGSSEGKKPPLTAEELDYAQRFGMSAEDYAKWRDVKSIEDYEKTQPKDTKD